MSLLHDLVRMGVPDKKVMRLLRKKHYSVNHQDPESLQTPLHVACTEGHENLVKLLSKKGADPNIQDSSGWTALHCAAKAGHLRICEFLLQIREIDVSILTIEKTSVLHYLVRKSVSEESRDMYLRVLKGVLDAGLDHSIRNAHGEAAIHSAVLGGNRDAIEFLLANGADPDCLTSYGETPLHYAIRSMNKDTLELLFQYDPNPNIKSENDQTPLDVATEYKATELIEILENHSKKPRVMKLKLSGLGASQGAAPADASSAPYGGQNSALRTRSRSKSFDSITRGLVVRSQRNKTSSKDTVGPSALSGSATPITAVQGPTTPNPSHGRPALITAAAGRAPPLSGGRVRSSTTTAAFHAEPPSAPRGISPRALFGDVRLGSNRDAAPLPSRVLVRQTSAKSLARSKSEIMKKINNRLKGTGGASSSLSQSSTGAPGTPTTPSAVPRDLMNNGYSSDASLTPKGELRRSTSAKLRGVLGSKRNTRLRAGSYTSGSEQLNTQRLEREALLKGTGSVLKRRKWKTSYLLIAHGLLWQFNTPQEMALLDSWEMDTLASATPKSAAVHGKEHCLELIFVGCKGRSSSKRHLVLVLSLESDRDRAVWQEKLNELLQQAADSPQQQRRRGSTAGSISPGRPGMLLSQECDLIEQQAPDSDLDQDVIAAGVQALQEADPQLASYEEIEYEPTPALQRALDNKLSPEVRARACRLLCVLLNESRSAQPEQKLSEALVTNDPGHLLLAAMCAFSEVLGDHAPLGEEFPMQLILFFEEHRGDYALELVHWAVDTEVARTLSSGAKHTPFRSTNLYTSLITAFFFGNEGRTFLIRTIGEDVARLARSHGSLEVDPKRARKGVDVKSNLKKLLGEAQCIISKIFNSIDSCPISVRRVLAHAQHVVKQHFPDLRRLVVGSFMFLRFLCPALVSPTRYGILLDEPTEHGMRALQLIAKLMLNLAHNVEFDGSKESYMSKMNHFITRNMSPLNAFFDRLVDQKDIQDRIKATTVRFNVVQPPDPTVLLAYHEYLCSRLLPAKLAPLLRNLRPEEQPESAYTLANSDGGAPQEQQDREELAETALPTGTSTAAAAAFTEAATGDEQSVTVTPRTATTLTTEAIACTETDMDSDEESTEVSHAAAAATASSSSPAASSSDSAATSAGSATSLNLSDSIGAEPATTDGAAAKAPDSPSGRQYRFFHSHKIKPLVDLWPTKPRPERSWPEDTRQLYPNDPVLVDLSCLERECSVELGSKREHYSALNEFMVEDDEMHNAFFYDYLYNREHINYIAHPGAHETDEGPVVLTIERSTRGGRGEKLKAIIRFVDEDVRVFVAGVGHGRSRSFTGGMGAIRRKDNYLRYLVTVCPRLAALKGALVRVDDPALSENLLKFEQQITIKRTFKFGVLPCPRGAPMTEEAMFGTQEISPALLEFLDWFGDRVRLQKWAHFRGGLDVKTDTTGTHSYYTEHRGFEIMYHVAPLLPYTEGDEQQLARKRHLGNDVVTIVFNESDQPFDESVIRSHFQHVFLVVRPEGTEAERRYRVAFVNRAGVDPYGPFLPYPAVFPKDQSARDFLLTKLINGERSAMEAPGFKKGLSRTRRTLLEDFCSPYLESK
mmetsp:Transcript_7317/g.22471  ORF Transcript_7317/g.22471 Transcript_7317/m.22471 type:complete len:1596 (+) Transcript_7317:2925-7712(+)